MSEKRRIVPEDLFRFRLPGAVHMHPAGDRAAFVVQTIDKEKNDYRTAIWVVGPGQPPRPFTGGETDTKPAFSPDGRHLAFISRRSGQPQVWVMPVDGGEAWQLTRVQGGVTEFAWSPDGRRIAFCALLDEEGIQPERKDGEEKDLFKKYTKGVKVITEWHHKLDGVGYFGPRRAQVCVVAVEPDAQPQQLTRPPYWHQGLFWSPDGQWIGFSSRRGPDYDRDPFTHRVYRIPAAGGEPQQISPDHLDTWGLCFSPDGQHVLAAASDPRELGYDNAALYLLPVGGGQPRRLVADLDRPVGNLALSDVLAPGGEDWKFSPDGRYVYGIFSDQGAVRLLRVEVASGRWEALTPGDEVVYTFSLDAACRRAVLGVGDPLNPGDLYWLDLAEGTRERLTEMNRELLASLDLSVPQRFVARTAGGPPVDAWVLPPVGRQEGQRYPAILSIHGGPMMMYGHLFFFEFQLWAARGYGVIYSNPRGSQGYGQAFCAAIRGDWGNHDYQDLMAVVDTALALYPWIDGDRLGVAGGSYGGFMTNWIVGHTDRFRAAATGRCVSDMRSMVWGDGSAYWIRLFGVPPWEEDAAYRRMSPITYAARVVTPVLIEHQEGDLRCPVDQADLWYVALKYYNRVPVKLVKYPDEFHGMSRSGKPWHRLHRLQTILEWFDTYLQGQGQPATH